MSYKGFFAAACVLLAPLAGCKDSTSPTPPPGTDPATTTYAASLGVNIAAMTKLNSSLYVQDLVPGTGAAVKSGEELGVVYTGWLANGKQFDSNVGKSTYMFVLGAGTAIAGWDQGLVGMKIGGTRLLVIGSSLGYGTTGSPPSIPSNSTLVFTVQILTAQ